MLLQEGCVGWKKVVQTYLSEIEKQERILIVCSMVIKYLQREQKKYFIILR